MTFTDMVSEVADRLNLTSGQALARIGRSINERYRMVVTSIGLQTSSRGTAVASATIGSQEMVFTNTTKIMSVYDATVAPVRVLNERTFDEIRNTPVSESTNTPQEYAIKLMGASSVTIIMDCIAESPFVLTADAYILTMVLSGSQVPAFSEDYHNILVYGAMATEYDKKEKVGQASEMEARYANRLADLQYFIAKSAYLSYYQGKNGPDTSVVAVLGPA